MIKYISEHPGQTLFQKSSQWSWMSSLGHLTSRGECQEFPKDQNPVLSICFELGPQKEWPLGSRLLFSEHSETALNTLKRNWCVLQKTANYLEMLSTKKKVNKCLFDIQLWSKKIKKTKREKKKSVGRPVLALKTGKALNSPGSALCPWQSWG